MLGEGNYDNRIQRKNSEEKRRNPEGWIFFDEIKESEKASKLMEILESNRWECFCEEGWIVIPLYFGRDQYNDLLWDYKAAKRTIGAR